MMKFKIINLEFGNFDALAKSLKFLDSHFGNKIKTEEF